MRDPVAEFLSYNKPFLERNPELVRGKVARMAEGPFPFFRGTFHLYSRDVCEETFGPLGHAGPEFDLVGDIHAENYGTFKADDGLVHYDINDFDETTTGRFGFDIGRLAASYFLAGRERSDPLDRAVRITLAGIDTYAAEIVRLLKGKGGEPDLREGRTTGCVSLDELIAAAATAKRADFIGKLTSLKDGNRKLLRSAKVYNLPAEQAEQAARLAADYVARIGLKEKEGFFALEDVAGRIAGIGSMGRLRYLALLAGKGSAAAGNVLLELKESLPSAYDTCRKREEKGKRAERVMGVMRASQPASNTYLGWATDGERTFQVRQLGPHDSRVEAKSLKPGELEEVARMQARLLARMHARAASRAVGPAEPLAELADAGLFQQRVLAFAMACADQACRDWAAFKAVSGDLAKGVGARRVGP